MTGYCLFSGTGGPAVLWSGLGEAAGEWLATSRAGEGGRGSGVLYTMPTQGSVGWKWLTSASMHWYQ